MAKINLNKEEVLVIKKALVSKIPTESDENEISNIIYRFIELEKLIDETEF